MTPEREKQLEEWGKKQGENIARNLLVEGKVQNMDRTAIIFAYQHALLITLSHMFKHDMSKAQTILDMISTEVSDKLRVVEQAFVAQAAANDLLDGIFKGNKT